MEDQSQPRRWSPTDDRRLRRLATSGHSLPDIADRLGRSERAVRIRIGVVGL